MVMVRTPVVAGSFYPLDREDCLAAVDACLAAGVGLEVGGKPAGGSLVGGLVPHAGWMCSGQVAGRVFGLLAERRRPTVVVLFGAVHRVAGERAALFSRGRWETPIGAVRVDERLGERLMGHTNLIADDALAHECEHSIEVQMPFVRRCWPEARVLPLMVPPSARAVEVGDSVGRTLESYGYDAVLVGTSDLTHYGPGYGFLPMGEGAEGLRWAKEENDRRMLDLVCRMEAEAVVEEARSRRNACGGGAIAALLAACRVLGARRGEVLEHTTSAEVLGGGQEGDAVGYGGVVLLGDEA